jgi:hypothetical protein
MAGKRRGEREGGKTHVTRAFAADSSDDDTEQDGYGHDAEAAGGGLWGGAGGCGMWN